MKEVGIISKLYRSLLPLSLLFFIFFFLNTSTVSATNIKWTGIANDGGLWSTPGNWSPAQVPVSGDSVTFDGTCTHCDVADVNTSAFITVAAGFTLHVTGSTWQSGKLDIKGSINFDGTSFTTTNDLIVRGGSVLGMSNATSFVVGGYFSNIGTIVFNTGNAGTMELDDTWEDDGGTLNLSGKNLILGGNGLNEIMCTGDFKTNTGVSSVVINKTQGSNSQVQVDGGCTLAVSSINSPALDENNSFISAYNGTLNVTGNVDAGEALIETFGSGTINISSTNWSGGSITVSSGGTIDASAAGTMTVKGYYGSFWGGGSGGNFYAPHTMSLVESSGGTPANFHGDTGIFYAGSGTLNVDGNFYGGANFNANTGTVNLTGVNQTINLDTTFNNLTKIVTSADTLSYIGAATQTVLGTFTLHGASGNNLTIQNLSAPTKWSMDAQGTRNLCYLSVRDSNNINSTQMAGFNLTDLHNNIGWNFISTASCGVSNDTIPPVPGTVSITQMSPASLTVSISGASDNVALSDTPYIFYNVTKGTNSGATALTSWLSSSLTPNTQYSFDISVTDTSGNTATSSASLSTLANPPIIDNNVSSGSTHDQSISGGHRHPIATTTFNIPEFIFPLPVIGNSQPENEPEQKKTPSVPKSSNTPKISEKQKYLPLAQNNKTEQTNSKEKVAITNDKSSAWNFVLAPIKEVGDAIHISAENLAKKIPGELTGIQKTNYISSPLAVALAPIIQYGSLVAQASKGIGSMGDLGAIILKSFYGLLALLGIRSKRRIWGTIYDSRTKQPIDPAIVELTDVASGKVVDTAITDLAGRYGFLIEPGIFKIKASKTHYEFPSKIETGYKDEIFDNLYHGETFEIKNASSVMAPNIPMDPLAFDWNQQAKLKEVNLHPRLRFAEYIALKTFYYLGFVWAVFVFVVVPSLLNFIIFMAYVVVSIVIWLWPGVRLWGSVYRKLTNISIGGAVLELSHPDLAGVVFGKAKSEADGKFFLKGEKGRFILSVKQPSPDGSAGIILGKVNVEIGKEGILNKDILL